MKKVFGEGFWKSSNINLNIGYYYFIIRSDGWTGEVAFSGINEREVSYKW